MNWTSARDTSAQCPRRRDGTQWVVAIAITGLLVGAKHAGAQAVTWAERNVTGPSARSGHAMAYDSARHVTVLFGGYGSPGDYSAETWEWDGTSWTERNVAGPSGRTAHSMAYDAGRGVIVLFGGHSGMGSNTETWEWNGTEWNQRIATGSFPAYGTAMAYDAGRGVTVLACCDDDMWEWDGASWMQRVAVGPPERQDRAIAHDTARGVTVLFGGALIDGTTRPIYFNDTWEWDETEWTPANASGPGPRHRHAMVFDTLRGVTVMFGGYFFSPNLCQHCPPSYDIEYSDTWELDGVRWTQRMTTGPSGRSSHAAAYDAARGVTVLFGGSNHNGILGDTWELVPCPVDFNGDGTINSQDFFDFLRAFFDDDADFNDDGITNIQDFFDFLTAFFAGCT